MRTPTFTECWQIVEELQDHAVLPYRGERSAQALQEQFQGTLLADVFLDFPEDTDINAGDLSERLSNTRHFLAATAESVYVGERNIQFTEDGKQKDKNIRLYPHWAEAADRVRAIAHSAVPGMGEPEPGVIFTPRLKNRNQLLFFEEKDQWITDNEDQDTPDIQKRFHLGWDQYRVVEQQEDGKWRERGPLTIFSATPWYEKRRDEYFSEEQQAQIRELWESDQFDDEEKFRLHGVLLNSWLVAEYDDENVIDPEAEESLEEGEEVFHTSRLVEKPYPVEIFNAAAQDPNTQDDTEVKRTIYAPLSYAPILH